MKKDILYIGVVEDNIDPKRLGRCKIRVQKVYDNIPVEHIPWSSPYIQSNGKYFNIPPIGKIVNVLFDNGNLYMPYYVYAEKYNINLQDKLESLSDDEYDKFDALLFDHRTRIYSEKESLTLDYLVNKIKIDKGNINLELKNNDAKINIGTDKSDQPLILGDHFINDWFMEFMRILLTPTSLVGNMGAPILKPELDAHIQKFMTNPKKFLSSNVFTVDNNKVNKLERDSITSEVEHDDTSFVKPKDATNSMDGKNVEESSVLSDNNKKKIKENQKNSTDEISNAVPSNTMSDKLVETKISDLDLSTVDVPEDVDLSKVNMKDVIDTSKVNLLTDDLSKITPDKLNLSFLTALGFTALAIVGLTKLIIDKIKSDNKEVKEERKNTITNTKTDTKTNNNSSNNTIKEDNYGNTSTNDNYIKTKKTNKRLVSNSPYTVDKRNRTDVLNSTKSKTYKRKSIIYKSNPNYGNYYDGII